MAVAIAVPTASGAVVDTVGGGPIRLLGWSVRKGATAMTIDLSEGSAGKIIAVINVAANGAETQWFGDQGVICNLDILYATITGASTGLVGSIWIA